MYMPVTEAEATTNQPAFDDTLAADTLFEEPAPSRLYGVVARVLRARTLDETLAHGAIAALVLEPVVLAILMFVLVALQR